MKSKKDKLDKIMEKSISERYRARELLREEAKPYYAESSDFEDKSIPGEIKNTYNRYITILVVGFIIVVFISFLTIHYTNIELKKTQNELNLLRNLGSTYYQGQNIFIRLNASDPKQQRLAILIEATCEQNNIENCMRGTTLLSRGYQQTKK